MMLEYRIAARILLNDIKKKHRRLKLFRAGYRGPIMDALANQEKLKIGKAGQSVQGVAKALDCRAIFRMAGACKAVGKTLRKSRQNAGSHDPATLHTNRNQQNYKAYLLDRWTPVLTLERKGILCSNGHEG